MALMIDPNIYVSFFSAVYLPSYNKGLGALTLRPPHVPSTRSLFFQSPCSYRSAKDHVEAKCRAPGDHEPLIGGAWSRSMGELRLGQSVTWSFRGWTYRLGARGLHYPWKIDTARNVVTADTLWTQEYFFVFCRMHKTVLTREEHCPQTASASQAVEVLGVAPSTQGIQNMWVTKRLR